MIRLLLVLSVMVSAQIATAQEASFPEWPGCNRTNASRLPASECGNTNRPPAAIRYELEPLPPITVPAIEVKNCEARVSLQYVQRNTVARVEGEINNDSCPASRGSFTISTRTADENGNQNTREFVRTWTQDDDLPLTYRDEYGIGEHVDLIRVRVLGVECRCLGDD